MACSSIASIPVDQASGTRWRETKDQFSRGDEKISSTRKRNLPPFTAVKAFEAAARHASFKLAARELCLSPSAVSHQIRALETYLATTLFRREGGRVSLTKTGRAYAGRLTDLLDNLADTTEKARGGNSQELRILSTPGFAARWLVPRLSRFSHAHAIKLRVADAAPSTDFASNDADVVVQWRDQSAPGLEVMPFLESARYPMAAPDFVKEKRLSEPSDLLTVPLLRDQTDDLWSAWFRKLGIDADADAMIDGPAYPNCEYATSAAEAGLGVTLGYEAVLRDTLDEGRLIKLFEVGTTPFSIYGLACETGRKDEPLIRGFLEWALSESLSDNTCPIRH